MLRRTYIAAQRSIRIPKAIKRGPAIFRRVRTQVENSGIAAILGVRVRTRVSIGFAHELRGIVVQGTLAGRTLLPELRRARLFPDPILNEGELVCLQRV